MVQTGVAWAGGLMLGSCTTPLLAQSRSTPDRQKKIWQVGPERAIKTIATCAVLTGAREHIVNNTLVNPLPLRGVFLRVAPGHAEVRAVKSRQVPVQWELGRFHLVAYRSKGALFVFGLQQMLDQPTRGLYAHIVWFSLVRCQFIPGPGHTVQTQFFELGADITTHG